MAGVDFCDTPDQTAKVGIVTKQLGSVNKAILMVVSLLLTGCLKVPRAADSSMFFWSERTAPAPRWLGLRPQVLIDHHLPSAASMVSVAIALRTQEAERRPIVRLAQRRLRLQLAWHSTAI